MFFSLWTNFKNEANRIVYSTHLLSESESVEFSLIESVICLFTDLSEKKYFSLLNQLILNKWISEKSTFHC